MIEIGNDIPLALEVIRMDGGTQSRHGLIHEKIDEYAQLMADGTVFPAVVVFYDGSDYWLADGFHRCHAAKKIESYAIRAEIKRGTRRDAKRYAIQANTRHGIPVTLSEKRSNAQEMLEDDEWSQLSNRQIAEECGLDHKTVGAIRRSIYGEIPQNPTNQPEKPVEEVEECVTLRTPREVVAQWFADNPELEYLSNREIARRCGVTEGTVRNYRKELQDEREPVVEPTPEPEPAIEPEPQPIEEVIATPEPEPVPLDSSEVEDVAREEDVPEPEQPIEEHTVVTPEPEPVEDTVTPEPELEDDVLLTFSSDVPIPIETQAQVMLDMAQAIREQAPAPAVVPFTDDVDEEENHVQSQGLPPALISSESNEWYTPAQYVYAARELMRGIDVDPASNATANKIIKALTYYDIESNGLDKPWYGRVWLNPPYGRDNGGSNQEVWSHRLLEQYKAGITKEAVLLVNANTEARWFQPFYDYLICFTNHRIKFYNTDDTPNQPTQGNALIYLGSQQERFIEIFKQFGRIVKAVD